MAKIVSNSSEESTVCANGMWRVYSHGKGIPLIRPVDDAIVRH